MARRRHEEPENSERWLVSYADFITLLFAFFTVMYATSQADNEKRTKFEQSFKKAFGMQQQGDPQGFLQSPFPTNLKDGSVLESPIKIFEDKNSSKSEIRDAIWQMINEKLSDEDIQKAGLKMIDDPDGVRVTLSSSKLFPQGSAKVLPEAIQGLDFIGSILAKTQRRLVVEGHTDDTQVASELYPSNWDLAAARASTIVRYLIKRHKVDADLVNLAAFADQRPLAPNTTEENRAKNRRIEILISVF